MKKVKYLSFLVFISLFAKCAIAKCGYESCNPVKDDQVNIHLVPHSHDDLGYLKTVEQYFYGVHDDYVKAGVQYILDSVIEALQKDKNRRFIEVETGFFWKWWLQQDNETRTTVKSLVNNGQLEFIGGGWSMNDEATTYYQSIIDQMTWGLRKLNETFGECGRPKVGWQIDPYGHSRQMASIFSQMGYDGIFLSRIDYQDLALRSKSGSLEFIWRSDPDNLGNASDIYTNVLFRHHNSPTGLCFDVRCNDSSIVDDPRSVEYNVNKKAEDFINNWVIPGLKGYASKNILIPMGGDFNYQYAEKYYKNIDKLIRYINANVFNGIKYNVIYSTPSCYLNAVHNATKGVFKGPIKTDDFLPYATSAHNYWTGYYSSRPTSKRYSKYANNFLQVCKQLSSFTEVISPDDPRLNALRESLATFQHHDAITGTEREHVAHDYIRMLHDGITQCEGITNRTLFHLVKSTNMTFTTCPMLNISECARTEQENKMIITVYNPLGRVLNKFVRIPIPDNNTNAYTIRDPKGEYIETQIVPIHTSFLKIPGRNSNAKNELVFKASNVPALGFKSFYFERNASAKVSTDTNFKNRYQDDDISVGLSFLYYNGNNGNYSSEEFSPSQPCVFRPDPHNVSTFVDETSDVAYSGPIVTEFQRTYGDWLSHLTRSYSDSYGYFNELVYLVGPLPYEKQGVEAAIRYHFQPFEHDGTFYTDTNGRGSIKRIRNHRSTWNVSIEEPQAGNYYPVTSKISIKSIRNDMDITIFTDRSLGGTSPSESEIELMIHRNTMSGGPGSLAEPLNEQAYGQGVVSVGKHFFYIRNLSHTSDDIFPEELAQNIDLDSWIFFAHPNGISFEAYVSGHVMEFSGLKNALPRNAHILTLEPWGPSQLLLRLENFIGADNDNAKIISVNVTDLFSTFVVKSMKETTLGANQWLEDSYRTKFGSTQDWPAQRTYEEEVKADFVVTLKPLEIRTFVLDIVYK